MTVTPSREYQKKAAEIGINLEVVKRALEYKKAIKNAETVLTLGHLCHFTGVEYKYLRDVVGRKRDPYRSFKIRKRSGGARTICVPEKPLLRVQKWIAENILKNQEVHDSCKAYHPGSRIKDCASAHINAKWLVKLDIANFFDSIHEVAVFDLFDGMGFPKLVSLEMARICTRIADDEFHNGCMWLRRTKREYKIKKYETTRYGYLPQGAPTSPFISNLVIRHADELLSEMAETLGFTYTRYADDLTFSSENKEMTRNQCGDLMHRTSSVLSMFDLSLNKSKISICPPGARKIVLGLLVDGDSPKLTRSFKSRIKNHVRNIEKHGPAKHAEHLRFSSTIWMLRHVRGLLAYSVQIEKEFGVPLEKRFLGCLPNVIF